MYNYPSVGVSSKYIVLYVFQEQLDDIGLRLEKDWAAMMDQEEDDDGGDDGNDDGSVTVDTETSQTAPPSTTENPWQTITSKQKSVVGSTEWQTTPVSRKPRLPAVALEVGWILCRSRS